MKKSKTLDRTGKRRPAETRKVDIRTRAIAEDLQVATSINSDRARVRLTGGGTALVSAAGLTELQHKLLPVKKSVAQVTQATGQIEKLATN